MIVVADTTPINYRVLIDAIDLLPALYDRVLVPSAVHSELLHRDSPAPVSAWAANLPEWCEVHKPLSSPDASLNDLDEGESNAIQLALDLGVDTLLMDEWEGRRVAIGLNLKVSGTIGILEMGAQKGLINFRQALDRLTQTNFRISASIRREFLDRNT